MDNSPVGGLTFRAPSPTSSSGIGSIKRRHHCSPSMPLLLHMDHQQQKRNTDELDTAVRQQRLLSQQAHGSGSPPSDSSSRDASQYPFIRAKRLRTEEASGTSMSSPLSAAFQSNTTGSAPGSNEWMNEAVKSELLRFFMHGRRQPSPEGASSSSIAGTRQYHQALFTEEQVVQICERLLREQRHHLELDFQRILNQKLADQYDAFRRFTQDQMHRQMQEKREDDLASYFS